MEPVDLGEVLSTLSGEAYRAVRSTREREVPMYLRGCSGAVFVGTKGGTGG